MEPGAEIKFRLRFMLTRGLNLGRARAFAEIKFHARMRCFVKDTASKTCPPLICVAQAASHIGATLDKFKKFRVIRL